MKPKKYYIKHKYLGGDFNYLNFKVVDDIWFFNSAEDRYYNLMTEFTLKELPKWVHEMMEQGHLVKEELE